MSKFTDSALSTECYSPVFVVGMPRSGTTLVSAILSAHSNIIIAPETHYLRVWTKRYPQLETAAERQAFLDAFTNSKEFKDCGLEADWFVQMAVSNQITSHRELFTMLLQGYAAAYRKNRWGEKTPGHFWYSATLLEWFPEAKIIYTIRDPRAVCASLLNVPWGHKWVDRYATQWVESVELAESLQAQKALYILSYEQLVTEPMQTVQALCHHLGEPYEASMLDFADRQQVKQLVSGEAWKENAARPITAAFIDKWQQLLTKQQIEQIELITEKKLLEHQYVLQYLQEYTMFQRASVRMRLYWQKAKRMIDRESSVA